MRYLPMSVCCLSRGHISKTKKDRPIVIMEYYMEVGFADSVASFRSPPLAPCGDILASDAECCVQIY